MTQTELTTKSHKQTAKLLIIGLILGLIAVKQGNPIVLYQHTLETYPQNFWEWVFMAWPPTIGFALSLLAALLAFCIPPPRVDKFDKLLLLPAIWFFWQAIVAFHSQKTISFLVLTHFLCCIIWFYIGALIIGPHKKEAIPWVGLVLALCVILAVGFDQRLRGLEETRQYFWTYIYPHSPNPDPEFLKRLNSNRIFSTLFYPNSLAGALLIIVPMALYATWKMEPLFKKDARIFLIVVLFSGAVACLAWSGSKAGWLVALVQLSLVASKLKIPSKVKYTAVATIIVLGLVAFGLRYHDYLQKGAKSMGARLVYWSVATKLALENPLTGIGQGNFGPYYARMKPPNAEMTRMVHNDFLQQATESGIIGFATYIALVGTAIYRATKKAVAKPFTVDFFLWISLIGWCMHNFSEFGLYIPAIGWIAFCIMGTATPIQPDSSHKSTT